MNDWFCSYLSNRIQSTQIGPDISKKQPMFCGVPQGSVLGPLLFLLYVNNIYRSSAKLAFYLFADDTNLLYADKNLRTLELVVNSELHKVYEWLTANKLTLNIKKSNFIIFRPHQKKIDYQVNLRIFDNDSQTFLPLEQKSYVKYLGVLIDSNLSWKYHIGHITSKISKTVGIIARLRYYVPTSVLLRIYQSLIFPYLSYGIVVWGHAAQTYINQILVLQKRALRLIYFTPYRSHAIPLFISSNTIPINMLYFKCVSILMHDVFNKQTPCNISSLFICSNELHNYNTRFSLAGNHYIKYSRCNHLLKSFSRLGAKIWNSIPQELRKVPKFVFKANLQNQLLEVLMEEDDYVGIPFLIKKISKKISK